MKFGELMKHNKPGLVISPRHEVWMAENSNPKYSKHALEFGLEQMALQSVPRDRSGSFSASSLTSCRRRQQFTYLGMPELPPSAKTAAVFQNGQMMHLRWQMAGLTEGWLVEAEAPLIKNHVGLSGTRDGIAHEGSVVEFKSIHTNGFARVNTFGPKEDHVAQVSTYALVGGHESAVIIYEDKNTQEYKEFILHEDDMPVLEITQRADEMWAMTNAEQLYEPLSSCEEQTGYMYTGCPFRDRCLKVREWDDAAGA